MERKYILPLVPFPHLMKGQMNMDMKAFSEKIRTMVEKDLCGGFRAEVREVRKNNGIRLYGLLISSKGQTVVPIIYLEPYLRAYEAGTPIEEVASCLMAVYGASNPKGRLDMYFFTSFEEVRDRICYRLIGKKRNKELLQEIPYMDFLDLAICFYYAYQGESLGDGMILINNSHMEMWGTNIIELASLAKHNTRRLFPWQCDSLEEVLQELADSGMCADMGHPMDMPVKIPMEVLSNSRRLHGAACILYPGVLEEIGQKTGSDFFILPSSIHEVLLLPDTGREDSKGLKKVISEVNRTQVAPEEVLSDTLYRYDREEKRVVIA